MADAADYLPYLAEYAKSNRSSCKKCKVQIPKDLLRMAVVYKSSKFDGKMTSWYHFDCFFDRQRPKSAGDIEHFDQLRYDDQEKINKKIESFGDQGAVAVSKGKGKKGKKELVDYVVDYAKSNRAACVACSEKIPKEEIRISKKIYDSEIARKYGPTDSWYHVQCFKEKRDELGLTDSIEKVHGFSDLSAEDKKKLLKELPAQTAAKKHKMEGDSVDGGAPSKKIKKEDDAGEKEMKEQIKKQNKILYKYRDELEQLSKSDLQALLEHNDQHIPAGKSEVLDLIADIMTFGALVPCKECKNGQFYYKTGGYTCSGDLTEWTKCSNTTLNPERKPFKVPKGMAEDFDFLKSYKYVARQRVINVIQPTPAAKPKSEAAVKVKTEVTEAVKGPPLKGVVFLLDSKLDRSKEEITKDIEDLGGKVSSRMSEKVAAFISTKGRVKAMDSKMEKAEDLKIPVVPLDILDEFKSDSGLNAAFLINKKNIAPWDCPDVEKRLGLDKKESKSGASGKESKSNGKSSKSSMPEKMTLKLKGGGVVDPDSGLEDKAHVLKAKDTLYSVVLGIVDIQNDKNSYYKMQILEDDKGKKWHLFRSWGRVGTKIGDKKLTKYYEKDEAIDEFTALYEEKTGNAWKNRKNFVKQPHKLYPLEIDYGEAESASKMSSANSKSKLPKSIQDLVCMLFDVESMKRAMVEFELDLTKMPLGKLSKKQLEKAYGILNEAQQLVTAASDVKKNKFVDVSNQFYTLIPHDFGRNSPPLLDNAELIKTKLEMLESLMEIEIAFSLLKAGDAVHDKDPIDAHYEKLNTDIEVLDEASEEFALIKKYVSNTHAATHSQYTLDIEDIFKVSRKGESKRFKPFSKLPNRKLLWHGSRVTNVAGILSQGLRIAPAEAPVTGYMFGKGIYFADMVSKSANYCMTSKANPTGFLLLADVALGKCYERNEADYIEKLKKGYQSVLGVGKTEPNPTDAEMLGDVQIPLGKAVPSKVSDTTLLYNEYIVYDIAQVNIKYLLKMKFNYK